MVSTRDCESLSTGSSPVGRPNCVYINANWWNGDRVLKPFTLNGYLFTEGEKFLCGSAMGHHLAWAAKYYPKI